MMTAVLLILCILSSSFTGNIYKKISAESKGFSVSAVMPAVWFAVLTVVFVLLAAGAGEVFTLSLVPTAVVSGICIAAAVVILIESMKTNALSVSIIIVNLNFIIPVVLSVLFLQESANPLQLAGMLLSITVIVFLNLHSDTAESTEEKSSDTKTAASGLKLRSSIWLPLAACIANGLVNFCIKINENSGMSALWFFAVMYASAMITCLVWGLLADIREKSQNAKQGSKIAAFISGGSFKAMLPWMLLIGACNGICFYTARLLAERMNAAAQFTVITCASILLSLVVGFVYQGDKFTKKTAVTIFFCVLAVICQRSGIA